MGVDDLSLIVRYQEVIFFLSPTATFSEENDKKHDLESYLSKKKNEFFGIS